MKLDNFLIVSRTFYLSEIRMVESMLTVIVNTDCDCYLCGYC